jgi:dihydrofolate reductase
MRKLKVQMNFEGINWDQDMVSFCIDNLKNVDNILLGRITAEAFIPYWREIAGNPDPNDINSRVAKPINDAHKVVFSNTISVSKWDNTTILNGNLAEEIKKLKQENGKDIIVYGGNSFVSSLVKHNLIDEYYLFVNPLGVRSDEPVLKFINGSLPLKLKECKPFNCGTILLYYL